MDDLGGGETFVAAWQCVPCMAITVRPYAYPREITLNVGLSGEAQQPQRKG